MLRGLSIYSPFPSVQLLDVTGPLQVFATANEVAASGSKSVAPYLLRVVAPGGVTITTSSGLALLTQPLPPMESVPDTLLIAGGLAAAYLKGFGCRPEHELSIRYKAGVRKPWKKEPAGKR